MYRTLLGAAGFRKGMDFYFDRHDGQAVCICLYIYIYIYIIYI